jgi:hypothetical protein
MDGRTGTIPYRWAGNLSSEQVVDDLVVLGRAVPEQIRNGRVTVCVAGHSERLGFVRIYPTKTTMALPLWSIVKVPLERDSRDTRNESWKIQGSRSEWDALEKKIEVTGELQLEQRLDFVTNLVDGCVEDINEARRSLGIVKPSVEKCYFCQEETFDPTFQSTLFGGVLPNIKKQYPMFPKIQYRCSKCRASNRHDQTVLEWGFYEWMRKNPDKPQQVWENAQLFSPNHECFFLVGNMRDRRTAFLVISILRLRKKSVSQALFPLRK